MADQIVITEKSSQATDVRAAVGSRYGEILPAEGHLFDLLEPEDVVPAWKHWSPICCSPTGFTGGKLFCSASSALALKAATALSRSAVVIDCRR
jgi:DNA topoisomerase III